MKGYLSFLLLACFGFLVPSNAYSAGNAFMGKNNCTLETNIFVVIVDTTLTSYTTSARPVISDSLSSIFQMEPLFVVLCYSPGSNCDYHTNYGSAVTNLNSYSPAGGSFNLDTAIQNSFNSIDEYFKFFSINNPPALSKKMVIFSSNGSPSTTFANYAKTDNFEVFTFGFIPSYIASTPTTGHSFPTSVNPSSYRTLSNMLSHLRKGKGSFCSMYGYGASHIITFDQNNYDFNGVGEFTLFDSTGTNYPLLVQVRQTPRETGSDNGNAKSVEIRAVSLQTRSSHIIMFFDPVEDIFTFWEQNNGFILPKDFEMINDGRLRYLSFSDCEIVFQKIAPYSGLDIRVMYSNSHEVNIKFSNYGSFIGINPHPAVFGGSYGLCGSFDSCPTNDFMFLNGTSIPFEKFTSTKSKDQVYQDSFFEAWRISKEVSPFQLSGFEEYIPLPDWKPLTSAPGFSRASTFCSGLPSFLYDNCLFDVGARQNLYASWLGFSLLEELCAMYCADNSYPFPEQFDPINTCQQACRQENVDLHTFYNQSNIPDIVLRGSNSPKAFFKPAIDLGGVYTFKLTANDLCDDQETEITVTITCDNAPVVNTLDYVNEAGKAFKTPVISANVTLWGYPIIKLFGSVTGGIASNLKYSWTVVNTTLPPQYTSEADYPLSDRINDANNLLYLSTTLRPNFNPYYVGTYTLELAVNDGCQITKSYLEVEVNCASCIPAPRIDAGVTEIMWQKFTTLTGAWQTNIPVSAFNSIDGDHATPLSFFWSFTGGKEGTLVEQVTSNEYSFYQLITPESSSQTTDVTENRSSNNTNTNINGPPFTQSVIPYIIPELGVSETYTTWSVEITTTVTTTTNLEVRKEFCTANINNPFGSAAQITFEETSGIDLDGELARCPGYYTLTLEGSDECYGNHTKSDSISLHLDCGLPPRAFISCNAKVEYDYNSRSFPSVTLDATGTYDPRPSAPTNANNLRYHWDFSSLPASSGVALPTGLTSRTVSFTPDIGGIFRPRLLVSNQCSQDVTISMVNAFCPEAAPTISLTPVTPNQQFLGSAFNVALVATGSHTFPSSLVYSWTVTNYPTVPPQISMLGVDFTPSFNIPFIPTPNVFVSTKGSYTVSASVSDGCLLPVSASQTFQVVCDASIATTLSSPTTSVFNYNTQSFGSVTLDASGSSIVGTGYTASETYDFFVVSDPSGSAPYRIFNVDKQPTFTPSIVGAYQIRFYHTDGCNYAYKDVTITTQCPQTPTAVLTLQNTGSILVGDTISFDGSSSGPSIQSYSWTLVSAPDGSAGFIGFSSTVSYVPDTAGVYIFGLSVYDGCKSDYKTTQVTVLCPTYTYVPAGTSSNSVYSKGKFSQVEVDGRSSSLKGLDPTTFQYIWEFVSAPSGSVYEPRYDLQVVVSSINNTSPGSSPSPNVTIEIFESQVTKDYTEYIRKTFLRGQSNSEQIFASCFYPDLPGIYSLRLTISNTTLGDSCAIKSTVVTLNAACNSPPSVVADDITVELQGNVQTRVILDASQTSDADGDTLTYKWEPILNATDPEAPINLLETVTNSDSPVASFIAIRGGSYPFLLTVSDGCSTITKQVTVTTSCPYAVALAGNKKAQAKHEKDMIVAKFNKVSISREAFELADSLLAQTCVNEYQWTLVDYTAGASSLTLSFALALVVLLVAFFNGYSS